MFRATERVLFYAYCYVTYLFTEKHYHAHRRMAYARFVPPRTRTAA